MANDAEGVGSSRLDSQQSICAAIFDNAPVFVAVLKGDCEGESQNSFLHQCVSSALHLKILTFSLSYIFERSMIIFVSMAICSFLPFSSSAAYISFSVKLKVPR